MVNIHFRGHTHPGGIWGPRTATLDWCEPNYLHSPYVAEMANTFSNLIMLAFALVGVYFTRREALPTRYVVAYAAFSLVAIGSFAFHGTLLYEMQLADELPMILSASVNVFALLDTTKGFHTYSKTLLAAILAADVSFALTYSTIWRHHLYHQGVFALVMLSIPARTVYLMNSPAHTSGMAEKQKQDVISTFVAGTVLYLAGFAIWNVDNIWCEIWDSYKPIVGYPTAFLLEGHAWWHVFTGLGTYYLIVSASYLTLCVKDVPANFGIKSVWGLPYVARVSSSKKQ